MLKFLLSKLKFRRQEKRNGQGKEEYENLPLLNFENNDKKPPVNLGRDDKRPQLNVGNDVKKPSLNLGSDDKKPKPIEIPLYNAKPKENKNKEIKEKIPEKDAWESYPYHEYRDFPLEIMAQIRYVDSRGQFSKRSIKTKRFAIDPYSESKDFSLLAYCFSRKANRTFKVSRINEFIDLDSGEFISDIPKYLDETYKKSPAGITEAIIEKLKNELVIFVYIARADSKIYKKEREAIIKFIDIEFPGASLHEDTIRSFLSEAPSQKELKNAIDSVISMDRIEAVLKHVDYLGKSRTKIDDFTSSAIALIRKQLSKKCTKRP